MPMSPPCPGAGWEDCLGITPLGCLPWLDVRIACDAGFENAVTVTPCQRKRDCTVLRYDAQNQDLLEFARLQSDRRCSRGVGSKVKLAVTPTGRRAAVKVVEVRATRSLHDDVFSGWGCPWTSDGAAASSSSTSCVATFLLHVLWCVWVAGRVSLASRA